MSPLKALDLAQERLMTWRQVTPRAVAATYRQDNEIIIRCSIGDGPACTMEVIPQLWEWAVEVAISAASKAPEVKS